MTMVLILLIILYFVMIHFGFERWQDQQRQQLLRRESLEAKLQLVTAAKSIGLVQQPGESEEQLIERWIASIHNSTAQRKMP